MMGNPKIELVNLIELINLQKEFNRYNYNQICKRKENNETESLWRKDSLYNIIVIIGYNDNPIQNNKGSAIFLHLCTNKYTPTKGCISVSLNDMKRILSYNVKKIKYFKTLIPYST